jgi:hypothetical protein
MKLNKFVAATAVVVFLGFSALAEAGSIGRSEGGGFSGGSRSSSVSVSQSVSAPSAL